MRGALIDILVKEAKSDPNFIMMTGDLGFSFLEPLQEILGERFINAGVAEANMISMAGALSEQNFNVFAYSIAPFITARCFEQIRNDLCYGKHKVRLIGVGAGYSYGTLGPTHHSLEDTNILAHLPGMAIISPASGFELNQAHQMSREHNGPIYYRISRENGVDRTCGAFDWANAVLEYRKGGDITLITSGPVLTNVFDASERLATLGIEAQVLSVPILAPFPQEALTKLVTNKNILTVYEGFRHNPLETGVMDYILSTNETGRNSGSRLKCCNAGMDFASTVGQTDYLRSAVGLSAEALCHAAEQLIKV